MEPYSRSCPFSYWKVSVRVCSWFIFKDVFPGDNPKLFEVTLWCCRWYAFLDTFDVAIKNMLEILACGHQSKATQELYLRDFFQTVQVNLLISIKLFPFGSVSDLICNPCFMFYLCWWILMSLYSQTITNISLIELV